MSYEIGHVYSISLADAVKAFESRSLFELNDGDKFYFAYGYVLCSFDDLSGQLYLDFYNHDGNLTICDGEEAELIDMDGYTLTFEGLDNEVPAPFKLSLEEAAIAVYA